MKRSIAFFYVSSMAPENDQALQLLQDNALSLGLDPDIERVKCAESMKDMFICPFVQDEQEHLNWYGIEGVKSFIRRVITQQEMSAE